MPAATMYASAKGWAVRHSQHFILSLFLPAADV